MDIRKIKTIISIAIISFLTLFQACSTVPLTGRSQFLAVSESTMIATSFSQYDQFLSENAISSDKISSNMVKTVGEKIANAVNLYMTENGYEERIAGFEWEFNLIEDKNINAWCMPGGKVVIYTGILPITQDETGLAVVMGHEIAHAIARHGSERMSQQYAVQGLSTGLGVALQNQSEGTQQLWMTAFGLGSQYGLVLPYSRKHESEADQLGLIFMAMAGYNPEAAVAFWQRMGSVGGEKPPEFFSTHPSDDTRISEIKKNLPKALEYYRP